ncbi:hypothetical protein [Terrabacter sp. C0L_2]|uniref:hypothetical protein n=1 Tax=Terrabacter sp. C0L_2 TaxID=3108389 RepID=UPI002ED20CE9|nr:hypothetical protein U5C87_05010 [Terrabacter sp. C0L_2]
MNVKRKMLGILLAVLTSVSLIAAFPASSQAETRTTIWKCYQTRQPVWTIAKSAYYTCVFGFVRSLYTDTGDKQWDVDGNCLNRYWNDHNRTTNYSAAVTYCRALEPR